MKALLQEYERFLRVQKGLAKATVAAYLSDLDLFFRKHDDFNKQTVGEYFEYLFETSVSESTVSRQLSSIKLFASYLYEEGVIASDIGSSLGTSKPGKHLPNVLTEDQIKMLLGAVKKEDEFYLRDTALLALTYGSGLRVSEVISLNESSIENMDFLRIAGKGNKERVVPIATFAWRALQDYLKQERPKLLRQYQKKQDALFLSKLGKPLSRHAVYAIIKKYGERIGVDISPHVLRHSVATHMLNKDANIRDLQEFLGHASISSTQIYTHVSLDHDRDVFNKAHPRS